MTEQEAVLGLMGPNSFKVMESIVDDPDGLKDISFGWNKPLMIDEQKVRVARMSYVGEFGYEVYIPVSRASHILTLIIAQAKDLQIGFAGHFCLDSCRLEKGFVHWGHDIGPDDDPLSAGLMFAVKMNAGHDFIGREAVQNLLHKPPKNKLTLFFVR